jgi:hypothetical protein
MEYNMTKTQALIIAIALIGIGITVGTSAARSQESKYDYKPKIDCRPGITNNKDGSTTYALPYPTFAKGEKNERGEPTVSVNWNGLVLFKQQDKNGNSKSQNCDK